MISTHRGSTNLNTRARRLRQSSTEAERRLWSQLRGRNLEGWKFRRQEPIGPYFADFMCRRAKLVIEVDGGQHADSQISDEIRTRFLQSQGFRVMRFWNHDVLSNTNGVLTEITSTLAEIGSQV